MNNENNLDNSLTGVGMYKEDSLDQVPEVGTGTEVTGAAETTGAGTVETNGMPTADSSNNQTTEVDEVYTVEEYEGLDGLEGLGNMQSNKLSSTPYGYLSKYDLDKRKIAVDVSKFKTSTEYVNYMKSWLTETGIVHADTDVNVCVNNCMLFALDSAPNIMYFVFIAHNITEVPDAIKFLRDATFSRTDVIYNKVIMGHINYGETLENNARQVKIEMLGLPQIYDINNAIDSALKSSPYFAVSVNKLSSQLCRELNKKYKTNNDNGVGLPTAVNMDSIGAQLKTAGNDIQESFTEGFEQLKSSLTGLFSSFRKPNGQ